MLKFDIQRSFEKHREIYIGIGVGTILVTGVFLGSKLQSRIFAKQLKGVMTLTQVVEPMFPATMPLSDIKDVVSEIDGAEFFDALMVSIDGVHRLIVR